MTSLDEHQRNAKHTKNCIGLIEDVKTVKCLSDTELINKYVSENKEIFETDGRELFCKICNKSIPFDTKCLVHRHLKAKKHQTVADKGKETKKKYLMKNFAVENSEVFEIDDAELFCKVCNIFVPSDKLNCLDEHLKTEIHIENYRDMIEDVKKVPVKRLSRTELLNKYVLENKEVFETDGSDLICKICKKSISFNRKCLVDRHLQSKNHQTIFERGYESDNKTQEDRELAVELIKMYVSENNEVFEADGERLLCKVCKKSVSFGHKKYVESHLNTLRHKLKYAESFGKVSKDVDAKHFTKVKASQDEHLISERHIDYCKEMMEVVEVAPIKRVSHTELLNKYVLENKEVFKSDGNELFCKICNESVLFETMFSVYRHLNSKKHQTEYLRIGKDIENCKKMLDVQKKVKLASNTVLLKKYVSENKEVFETDGKDLICKICKNSISFGARYLVYRHLQSKKHQSIVERGYETESQTQEDRELIVGLLNMYVSKNNEVFEADGELLLCKVCKMSVPFKQKRSVDNHLKTQKHRLRYAQRFGIASKDVDAKHFDKSKGHSSILQINEDFCRTCMKQFSKTEDDKQSLKEIPKGFQNSISIMKLLEDIQPQIKVEINDNLPIFMCSDCIQKLLTSYDFIEMYQNASKRLKQMLEEFGTNKHNILDEQQELLEEIEMPIDMDFNNYDTKIEPIHNDCSEKEIADRDNEFIELRNEPIEDVSDSAENSETTYLSSGSDDEWTPEESCLDASVKQENSDQASNKVFKGFLQPEENKDGSLTCQLCETVLKGPLYWRNHIRLHHLQENPKSQNNRRSNGPRKRGSSYVLKRPPANADGLYHCEFCGKTYPKYFLYRRHLLIHKGEPYSCIHTRLKKHKCEYCDMRFLTAEKQRHHIRTHTVEKPYRCKYCESAFAQSNDWVKHLRQHLGDNVYQCDLCPLRFPLVSDLRVHFATHKDDDAETRARNLQVRMEEERNLQIRLGSKEIV